MSPKRIATRMFCCLLRHAHPSDSRYCFATARARPFALCLFMLSASHACKHAPAGNPARRMAPWQLDSNSTPTSSSLERRGSSRTFRYGYLVTTSPQLSRLPSTAPSIKVRSLASGIRDSHGVTGGVYKTRERIHRDILIRDY